MAKFSFGRIISGEVKEGDSLPRSPWVVISQRRITRFAQVTGDRNPIHLDPEFARRVGLSGTIAHGLLLISLIPRLLGIEFPLEGQVLNREIRWEFLNLVRSGDLVQLSAVVDKVKAGRRMIIVTLDLAMELKGLAGTKIEVLAAGIGFVKFVYVHPEVQE